MKNLLPRVSILSLQQMALRKVAVLLWNEPRILVLVQDFRFRCRQDWHENVESKVSYKISKLQLPNLLEKLLMRILKPVGLQIVNWKLYHERYLCDYGEYFHTSILEKLCWTAAGAVDYRKTAEELVHCDVLDIVRRYKLACLYCFDHYILELWKELPQNSKRYFYPEKDVSFITEPVLKYSWYCIREARRYRIFQASFEDLFTFNQFVFLRSSFRGNETVVKYFLQKLSPEEREVSLIKAVHDVLDYQSMDRNTFPTKSEKRNNSVVLFYLLSEMTTEQQIQILSQRPADVLGFCLDWPGQDAFLDFADEMWTWLQCEDPKRRTGNYDSLLRMLENSIRNSDYFSPSLYQNFFKSSPNDFKIHFVDRECCFGSLFMELLSVKDSETINVILSNLDTRDRVRLLSSKRILKHFHIFISRGEGQVVEMCLRRTGLSHEGIERLKEAFMEFQIDLEIPEWRRFFEFLDEVKA